MTKLRKAIAAFICMVVCVSMFASCAGNGKNAADEKVDLSKAITLNADFNDIVDPPLLKKVAMYNAGVINPLSHYDRDFDLIKDMYADSMRMDLSIGKSNGTAGQYLVGEDFEITDWNNNTGTYNIKIDSLNYDFSQLDRIVDIMADYDVLPYMSWDYIPYPLQEDGKWNNLDQNILNWKEVWEEIYYQYAKHYLDEGVRVGYHEIYNEPDLEILKCWGVFDSTFDGFLNWDDFCLGSQCSPGEGVYPDMYEYGAKGILRADPDATIGGPGFALGEIGVESWVGFLPRVLDKQLPLDFYSFHTYLDGNTWFRGNRKSDGNNEIEKVVAGLATNPYFLKTAIHINEYSYLNEATGSTNGQNSDFNFYPGAYKTIDGLLEAVERTNVQWLSWAQFMETGGDPYGLVNYKDGRVKAAYNALKIYNDMPVWRYNGTFSDNNAGLKTLVSSSDDKIGILIWNENESIDANGKIIPVGDRVVTLNLNNAKFASGKRRVYKIDSTHASYYDTQYESTPSEHLVAEYVKDVNNGNNVWSGVVPAEGMVYITINKNGAEDFKNWDNRTSDFAQDIKTQYYYEDRYRGMLGNREIGANESWPDIMNDVHGSYSHFDRLSWTMYLGMGECLGVNNNGKYANQAHASAAVLCRDLPTSFKVAVNTEGGVGRMLNNNTTLGFRIDYYNEKTGNFDKSVYFYYDNLYRATRDPNSQDSRLNGLPDYPWGTEEKADVAVSMTGNVWQINMLDYAPEGWRPGDKVQISFDMQNTGANTRASFHLYD